MTAPIRPEHSAAVLQWELEHGHNIKLLSSEHASLAQLIADIEAAARLVGARAMQEAAAEEARTHSCQTWSELCDCGGYIAHDIRALVPEDVVKEADRAR